jgi:hypothetical protein
MATDYRFSPTLKGGDILKPATKLEFLLYLGFRR